MNIYIGSGRESLPEKYGGKRRRKKMEKIIKIKIEELNKQCESCQSVAS